MKIPNLTFDEADKLWRETNYALYAAEQDLNPINAGDATAFFLEGYEYAQRQLEGAK